MLLFVLFFINYTIFVEGSTLDWEPVNKKSQKEVTIKTGNLDWEKIKNKSKRELSINPDNIILNFKYGIAMANLGMIEEAYDHFDKLAKRFSQEDLNNALKPYLLLLKDNKNDILVLNYAAFSASVNNNYKLSAKYFEDIISLTPENVWIRNYLAATLINLEKYNKAEKVLKDALKIMENDYTHFLLSIVYYKTGQIFKFIGSLGKSGKLINKFIFD